MKRNERSGVRKSNTTGSVKRTDSSAQLKSTVHRSQSETQYPDSADRTLSETSSSSRHTPRGENTSSSSRHTPRGENTSSSSHHTPRGEKASSSSSSSPRDVQPNHYSFYNSRVRSEQTYLYFRVEPKAINYQQYSLTEEQSQKYIDDFYSEIQRLLKDESYEEISARVALVVSKETLLFKRIEACVKSTDKNDDEKLKRIKDFLGKVVLVREDVVKRGQEKLCAEVQKLFQTRKSLKTNCLTSIDSNDKKRAQRIEDALKYKHMLVEINATHCIWIKEHRNLQWEECAIQNLIKNEKFSAKLYVPGVKSSIKFRVDLSASTQEDVPAPSPQKKKGIFGR